MGSPETRRPLRLYTPKTINLNRLADSAVMLVAELVEDSQARNAQVLEKNLFMSMGIVSSEGSWRYMHMSCYDAGWEN